MDLAHSRVIELLDYDPGTGIFRWKPVAEHPGSGRHSGMNGKRAGFLYSSGSMRGYRGIGICGHRMSEHRLAWFYVYGSWPHGQIDHIDGNPANNAITNLRDVDPSTNKQNMRKPHATNKSGFLGVTASAGGFFARIKAGDRRIYIGTFATAEEAHEAYLNTKRKLHSGCTL